MTPTAQVLTDSIDQVRADKRRKWMDEVLKLNTDIFDVASHLIQRAKSLGYDSLEADLWHLDRLLSWLYEQQRRLRSVLDKLNDEVAGE